MRYSFFPRYFIYIRPTLRVLALSAAIAVTAAWGHSEWLKRRSEICLKNLDEIEGAKGQWAFDHDQFPRGLPIESDLIGDKPGYLKAIPVCPTGKRYQINPVSREPECTSGLEGHAIPKPVGSYLPGFEPPPKVLIGYERVLRADRSLMGYITDVRSAPSELGFHLLLCGLLVALALVTSFALLQGIASTREVSHRITPQSPWYFFDFEFKPRGWRTMVLAPVAFLAATFLLAHAYPIQRVQVLGSNPYCITTLWLWTFTWPTLVPVVLFAPHFRSPWALALTGAWIAPAYPYLVMNVFSHMNIHQCTAPLGTYHLIGSFLLFDLAWIYVRRIRGDKWFLLDRREQ